MGDVTRTGLHHLQGEDEALLSEEGRVLTQAHRGPPHDTAFGGERDGDGLKLQKQAEQSKQPTRE